MEKKQTWILVNPQWANKEELEYEPSKIELPSTLIYKFRPDNDSTEKIFTEQSLWFSRPSAFNDPFDCNAGIGKFNPQQAREFLITCKKINRQEFFFFDEKAKNMIQEITYNIINKAIDEKSGILCTSRTNNNTLMWSHYAKEHSGICLEFDVGKGFLPSAPNFSPALVVEYNSHRPILNPFAPINEQLLSIIKVKSPEWMYEQEVRFVCMENKKGEDDKGFSCKFNKNSLTKIIFGCKTTQDTIQKYKELCTENGFKNVNFSKMKMDDNAFF